MKRAPDAVRPGPAPLSSRVPRGAWAWLCLSFVVPCLALAAPERSLSIVTSFPARMTSVFKTAFEQRHPDVKVEIIHKKTSAGLKYLDRHHRHVDLFWVSAPDAFEVLKDKGLLQPYRPRAAGIPRRLSGYPVNDPDGYYSGFAAAGYGIMWNRDYLRVHGLPEPRQWIDLSRPEYRGHIALSAPSRSGTTHLTIEAILQLRGWRRGWALIKAIAANARTITAKSSDVPAGVASGRFGIGIVIDFYGLTAQAGGAPTAFVYPSETVLVPANIGILKDAPQPGLAQRFIEFLLSPAGQRLLLAPQIQRLPIRPLTYLENDLPAGFPRPFSARALGAHVAFDVLKSRRRYNVVNSLFDVMITYRLDALRAATTALRQAESRLQSGNRPQATLAGAAARAQDAIDQLPIDELTAEDPHFAALFTQKRKKASDRISGRQREIEESWDAFVSAHYRRAKALIDAVPSDRPAAESTP